MNCATFCEHLFKLIAFLLHHSPIKKINFFTFYKDNANKKRLLSQSPLKKSFLMFYPYISGQKTSRIMKRSYNKNVLSENGKKQKQKVTSLKEYRKKHIYLFLKIYFFSWYVNNRQILCDISSLVIHNLKKTFIVKETMFLDKSPHIFSMKHPCSNWMIIYLKENPIIASLEK